VAEIVMYGLEKPANVTVYVKLVSWRVPGRMTGVQFGFGQTCVTELGLTDRDGMVSLPFFVEATVTVLEAENVVVWDSTGLFGFSPGLKQSTIAV
jgi:hypothetical protein